MSSVKEKRKERVSVKNLLTPVNIHPNTDRFRHYLPIQKQVYVSESLVFASAAFSIFIQTFGAVYVARKRKKEPCKKQTSYSSVVSLL